MKQKTKDKCGETVNLALFCENPDNPSVATDEDIARLAGKLKRVPLGLTAMRIAYVTDMDGDERTRGKRVVISGNKRLRVLKQAYGEDGEVPAEWFADVTAMSEAERHEFIVSANVSDGSWDVEKLLAQYDRSELGELMKADEVAALLADVEEPQVEGETDPDAVPEVPVEPKSRRGAVYQLGRHRVMCGDSTKAEDVARLMGGAFADMVFTDPPWNVAYGSNTQKGNPQGYKVRTILNDSMTTDEFHNFMNTVFARMNESSKRGAPTYVVMSAQEWGNLMLSLKENGYHWSSTIIWAKDTLVLSRKDYHTQYEPIWYGWHEGESRLCEVKDRKQSDLWQIPRPKRSDDHPTMKPVDLVVRAIENSSRVENSVLDIFGGSGTTILAAEKTRRVGFSMELDPKYVDVIRRRWAEFVHGEGCDWESLTPEVAS